MKRVAALIVVTLVLAACSDSPSAPLPVAPRPELRTAARETIAGSYIVVFADDVSDPDAVTTELVGKAKGKLKHAYKAALKGFAAELSDAAVTALREDPRVSYVEEDQVMHASTSQSGATWGLDRINQRNLPLDGTYSYTYTGSGVRAYIIDTGIYTSHTQFGGRASNVYDAFGGNGQDCNGHGTHVAGTVGSATYGVAKAVYLRGVRVLDCSGSGATSGIIAAIDWVRLNRINPAVANMSLGGGYSSSLNTAVTNLSNSGVFIAVAAGNENQDACNVSPASAAGAYTVAASTSTDAKASYSNYGGCVNIYAPGSSITSTWNNGGTNTISGTSMATPHVTGVSALIKQRYGDIASSTVWSYLDGAGTANLISGNPTGTKNLLLYKYVTSW